MKELRITEKTKVVKNEIENYQKLLAKYRKQKSNILKKQRELKDKMSDKRTFTKGWYNEDFKQLEKEYEATEKKLTKINFFVELCEEYRKAWIELYAFNILKDNKDIITRPLYYKKEQERLFKYFDFKGLTFEVYKREWLAYNNGLYMYDQNDTSYNNNQVLNEDWLDDLSQMPNNLRYRYEGRYLSYKNFEKLAKEKYKQIIKIAKKTQKYIDTIEEEREKLGYNFQYKVAKLSLDYAKDWQKYKHF